MISCCFAVQLEAFCGVVGFNEMSDSEINAACQSLFSSSALQFSCENSHVLARHMLLPPVTDIEYFLWCTVGTIDLCRCL